LKFVNIFIVAAIALLSIAAGLAKVMQSPQEMEFLQGLGLSSFLIMVFGLVQITGGVLIAPKKTRLPGAVLVALGFAVSAVLIFIGGNVAFGLFSLIPAALAGMIIYQALRTTQNKPSNADDSDAG
jgi:hypothetical protein